MITICRHNQFGFAFLNHPTYIILNIWTKSMFFHLQVGLPMPLTITGPPIPVRPNTFWRKSRRIWVAKSERWRLWHDFSMAKISTNQSRPSWITVYIIAGLIFRETNGSIISLETEAGYFWGGHVARGVRIDWSAISFAWFGPTSAKPLSFAKLPELTWRRISAVIS